MSERFKRLEIPGETRTSSARPGEETVFDAQHFCTEGRRRFWRGDFEGALREYSRALKEDAHRLDAWAGQLRCLLELQEYPETVLWARKAEERVGPDPVVLALRATALARLSQTDEALGLLDTALACPRPSRAVWVARGEVVLGLNARNAEFCFLKAQEGDADADVQAWIARAYERGRRPRQAVHHYRACLTIDDGRAWVWLRAGICYERLMIVSRAHQAFEQALRLRPSYVEAEKGLRRLSKRGLWTRLLGWFRSRKES